MKIEVTLQGVKVTRDIPTSWDGVTFKQFLEIILMGDDYVQILALFLEIDIETVRKATIKGLDGLIIALGFIHTRPIPVMPRSILKHEIPKDLGFETIAQFEDLKTELKGSAGLTPDQHLQKYPLYCAIYACKPYDWKKSEEMAPQFFNAPCQEVLGIGNFTLAKLIGLKRSTGPSSLKHHTLKRRFMQALTVYRLLLVSTVRSFTWKRKPVINEANS